MTQHAEIMANQNFAYKKLIDNELAFFMIPLRFLPRGIKHKMDEQDIKDNDTEDEEHEGDDM